VNGDPTDANHKRGFGGRSACEALADEFEIGEGVGIVGAERERGLEVGEGVVEPSGLRERHAEVVEGFGELGTFAQDGLVMGNGFGGPTDRDEGAGEIEAGVEGIGVASEDAAVALEGVGGVLGVEEGIAEIGFGDVEIGFEAEGGPIGSDGVVDLVESEEGVGEVGVGVGEVGVEARGFPEMKKGGGGLSVKGEQMAEIAVGLGVVWLELKAALDVMKRAGDVTGTEEGGAEIVVEESFLGGEPNGLAERCDGFLNAPEGEERLPVGDVGAGEVRPELNGGGEFAGGVVEQARFGVDMAEVESGHPTVGISGDDGVVERDHVAVTGGFAPGVKREDADEERGGAGGDPSGSRGEACGEEGEVGGEEGDRAEEREVLPVVGDEGVAEGVEIEETDNGKQRAGEEEEGGERAARAAAEEPEGEAEKDEGERPDPLRERTGVGRPARVDENEVHGPEGLAEIEPHGASGDEDAFEKSELKLLAGSAEDVVFDPGIEETDGGTEDEPGQERNDIVAPAERAAFPPEDDEERGGQRRGHRFREQGEDEKNET
jgi:AAA ATPase containing von Willebrand factor type A (vWA) domain